MNCITLVNLPVDVFPKLRIAREGLPACLTPERTSGPLRVVLRLNVPEPAFLKLAFALLRESFANRNVELLNFYSYFSIERLPVQLSNKLPPFLLPK